MYIAEIYVAPTGNAATVPWVLYNPGPKTLRIDAIRATLSFYGTTASGSKLGVELVRATLAAPTDGSAAAVVLTGHSSPLQPTAVGLFLAAGVDLAAESVVAEACSLVLAAVPVVDGAAVPLEFVGSSELTLRQIVIPPGSGLLLRLLDNAVAGEMVAGSVEFSEV